MDAVEVRVAIPADADPVAGYHARCVADTFSAQLAEGEFEAPRIASTREQLWGWFQPGSGFETYVAAVDGVPVAHFTVYGAHLVHLFVAPEHQGTGLGHDLLLRAEALLAQNGHTCFELHARVGNVRAIAFYEQHGWEMTGRIVRTVEHDIAYNEHVLVKHLG